MKKSTKELISVVGSVVGIFAVLLAVLIAFRLFVFDLVNQPIPPKQGTTHLSEIRGNQLFNTHIEYKEYCLDGVRVLLNNQGGMMAKWNIEEDRPYICADTDGGIIVK